MVSRPVDLVIQHLAVQIRPWYHNTFKRFPIQDYVRLIYNDALTFDPVTKRGGLRANFRYPSVARNHHNRRLQLLASELEYLKNAVCDPELDPMSVSDWVTSAAVLMIKEADGPNIQRQLSYGRVDINNVNQVGDPNNIPNAQNYKQSLAARGFNDEEIAALASVEALGLVQDPAHTELSSHLKIDNFFYKQVLAGRVSHLQISHTLLNDPELKGHATKYAEDNKAYIANFGNALLKLTELGNKSEELTSIEHLIDFSSQTRNKF
ncbi:cytosolic ascorbate peroxidase [Stylonychia lemnae]|uniref:Cytosolic ascorbate peroxidase n=1 Tax=Stylonychia lemnae TaxID=5949 RepID=A0A078B733_STYLE|nr:cytosolic ascorbate peroxidase [Stylonychia lemnae]|eukprot:CDW89112.1 cytosolic ascorbate peroxidase [Stylonychia lemnae]